MTIFIGYSESLRMLNRDRSRLHGLISIALNVVGEDAVGIGTDFTQGYDKGFYDWISHDKGSYRKLTEFGTVLNPLGFRTIGEFPNLTAAMHAAGMQDRVIEKVLGENWLRILHEVWSV